MRRVSKLEAFLVIGWAVCMYFGLIAITAPHLTF